MSRVARFFVIGQLDMAGGAVKGTVEIERASGIISVRRHRSRRTYSLPLSDVATMICRRILMAEAAEKRAAKRKGKRRLNPPRRP